MSDSSQMILRRMGLCDYTQTWAQMRAFTDQRTSETPDQLWALQHPPVFTQGQAGKPEHLLAAGNIPVVQSDRGGQITYHGPGQLVMYVMVDLHRRGYGIRSLVTRIEGAIVTTLAGYGVTAYADPDAPGVYVDDAGGLPGRAKIGSLGLRVRRGCTFHGLALNVDMDMEPFLHINPCGYIGQRMTQLADLGCTRSVDDVATDLAAQLQHALRQPGKI